MTAQRFIVGDTSSMLSDRDFVIITAPDAESAETEYLQKVAIHDDIFFAHVYERIVNASFAEHFWLQTPEEKAQFAADGAILASAEDFNTRVRKFFGEHQDFAQKYLDFYWDESEVAPPLDLFPDDMLLYMLVGYPDWINLEVIPLSEIEEIGA